MISSFLLHRIYTLASRPACTRFSSLSLSLSPFCIVVVLRFIGGRKRLSCTREGNGLLYFPAAIYNERETVKQDLSVARAADEK